MDSEMDSKSNTNVSVAWCLLGKGEDSFPGYVENDDHIAMVVCDGHNGNECSRYVSSSMSIILNQILKHGVTEAMQNCLLQCSGFLSGGVITMALLNKTQRLLSVASVGDCNCVVYQDHKIVFAQPHHTWQDIQDDKNMLAEFKLRKQRGEITEQKRDACVFTPTIDGLSMNMHTSMHRFKVKHDLGEPMIASFLGHLQVPRMEMIIRNFEIQDGPFRIIMSSDGLTDVIHNGDEIMYTHDAHRLKDEAIRRWTTDMWTVHGYSGLQRFCTPSGRTRYVTKQHLVHGYNRPNIIRGVEQHPHADGADDISVLVLDFP
jgi:serine/threonine protein phosphatase PrpC